MPSVLSTILITAVIVFLVMLCIRNLVKEHQRGERCECIGDCSKCKIRCQSNPNYYGIQRTSAPDRGVSGKDDYKDR